MRSNEGMTRAAAGAFYIDYPGIADTTPVPINERLYDTEEAAVEVAVAIYRDSDIPKVIVCEFPTLRRVVSIWGDRAKPRIVRRPG